MSNNKKMFSTLATITAGAIAGTALALSPVVAIAGEHGEKACKGEKHDCKCAGEKKAECEKGHHDEHGEKACGGEGKCSGKK